jgi:hypothetical protein
MEHELSIAVVVAVVTGAVSTLATVTALRVHITYLRESIVRIDSSMTRAHARIDEVEHRANIPPLI